MLVVDVPIYVHDIAPKITAKHKKGPLKGKIKTELVGLNWLINNTHHFRGRRNVNTRYNLLIGHYKQLIEENKHQIMLETDEDMHDVDKLLGYHLHIDVYLKNRRPDHSNVGWMMGKIIPDALQESGVIGNDRLIKSTSTTELFDAENPRAVIYLSKKTDGNQEYGITQTKKG